MSTVGGPRSWRAVVKDFETAPRETQEYFKHLPKLAKEFPWDVALSYLFARVELAHNMAIYCGVVKLHRANADLARRAVEKQYMKRAEFKKLFKTIFGKEIKEAIWQKFERAASIRDKVMHGKPVAAADKRKAVVDIISYAQQFNKFVSNAAGFKPFGSLRGFKGRGKRLDKSTTRWLLKGMGFEAI